MLFKRKYSAFFKELLVQDTRLASEAHDAQQKEEAVFVQKMYGQPAQDDNLSL